jgi:hypothetical protein
VANRYAVFVSAGAAGGDGTKEAPFGTIGEGVTVAKSRGTTRVIVCNAIYTEKMTFTPGTTGVNVFGGFTCPSAANGWVYTPVGRPLVSPPTGTALYIDGVTERVTIQDVDFKSADATAAGTSSIAAIVSGSTATLRRVAISAGKGANGANGADGAEVPQTPASTTTQNGAGASCSANAPFDAPGGNPTDPSTCGSLAGQGGDGRKIDSAGEPGDPGSPANPTLQPDEDGAGGLGATGGGSGGTGKWGARGASGTPGGKAAESGAFNAIGYTPASGHDGTPGSVGQGGGGGRASKGKAGICVGAGGGAGGQGGCGGTAGRAGGGGGASVALLSWESTVLLEGCALGSDSGGRGGIGGQAKSGVLGVVGGRGGDSAPGDSIGSGGDGGGGGSGGPGGPGSGGTGGPSVRECAALRREHVKARGHGSGGLPELPSTEAGEDQFASHRCSAANITITEGPRKVRRTT